jgi:hypothetical protein
VIFHSIAVVFPEMEKFSDWNLCDTPRIIHGRLESILKENVNPTGEEFRVAIMIPRVAIAAKRI